jgi:PAS domain S-box-containing protein
LILYGNRSALSLFAVFEEEIAGRSLRQCVAAPDRAVLDGMIEKLSATQRPVDVLGTVEISGLSKIGRVFPMEMSLASWKTGSNRYFAATFRDISERRKMEENIRKSAAQIADLYDNAPCGYHSVDRNGVVVQMNATELAWLGHSRDEVIGKRKLTDLIVPPDRHVYEENFPVLTSEGRIADLEFRLQRKDGTEFPVIMSATAVKDEHGGFVMSRATVYDLTDRRRAEEAMRESELKFRSIAESAQDGIVLADRNGRIVYENRSARVLFAYTDPGLVGREIRDLVSEAHHAELSEVLKKAAGKDPKGLGHVYEWSGVDRHGRTFPMELSFASWTGDGKRFIAGIIRDVTERRRAEAHLKFQAEILAQVKDAVVVTNSGGQIIYCSPAAETLTGRKMSEAIGQDLRNVVGEVVKPEAEKEMIEAINAGHVWRGETVHRRKDGKELAVEFSISPLRNETGQPVGRLHIIREVTQQKKLQDMLMHAEKLAAMGQMAAAVAHELKTPLSVIFGFADVMLKKIKPEHKTEHPLDVIKRQAMRCSNLVTNLLEFSRKEKAVHREFFDLNEPVESALSLVQAHAQTSSIRVDKRLASGTLRLLGNRDLVQQVVINLCLNAVDAMSRGGTLTVNTRVRKFSRGEFAQIQVTDTGPGIPPDIRERIFEPFFTTKKSDKGTGLGLWLVKEIVSALGGEIECRSEIGNGTDFTVLLPLPEEAEEDAETPSRGESPRKKKTGPKPRLAVVDDEKDFRDLLARWLESNYEVDCYSEGEGIVSELTERRPDLIILDVRMPGIDGFEICRRIRTEKKLAQVPILFLTASKKDLQTLATLEFGANSHMSKPVERENLLRRLEELLLSVPAE